MKLKSNNFILAATTLLVSCIFVFSCKKHEAPPLKPAVTGTSTTIQQLRSSYVGMNTKFTSNTLLNAVVTVDETSGNLYKQVYVRDNSGTFAQTNYYGAISLHFKRTGTNGLLSVGDSVSINLNGATLAKSSGGALEIDSLDPYSCITKLKTGLNPQPLTTTIPQLYTYSGGQFVYDAQLVQLSNVEFIQPNVNTPYAMAQAPPVAPISYNRYISDFTGNTIITYNSGYANFAYSSTNPINIPNNSGSIVAVANLYTTMQLTLRSFLDVNLTNNYSPIVYDTITQNFRYGALSSKAAIMTAGWKTIDAKGSLFWQGGQYGAAPNWSYSPSISDYKASLTDTVNDVWLISPPILAPANSAQKKYMDFTVASQYCTNKALLKVMVSGDYDGLSNPAQATWTDISSLYPYIPASTSVQALQFRFASDNSFLLAFGPQDPPTPHQGFTPPVNTGKFYVAFRYKTNTNHSDSTGSTYLLGSFFLRNN